MKQHRQARYRRAVLWHRPRGPQRLKQHRQARYRRTVVLQLLQLRMMMPSRQAHYRRSWVAPNSQKGVGVVRVARYYRLTAVQHRWEQQNLRQARDRRAEVRLLESIETLLQLVGE